MAEAMNKLHPAETCVSLAQSGEPYVCSKCKFRLLNLGFCGTISIKRNYASEKWHIYYNFQAVVPIKTYWHDRFYTESNARVIKIGSPVVQLFAPEGTSRYICATCLEKTNTSAFHQLCLALGDKVTITDVHFLYHFNLKHPVRFHMRVDKDGPVRLQCGNCGVMLFCTEGDLHAGDLEVDVAGHKTLCYYGFTKDLKTALPKGCTRGVEGLVIHRGTPIVRLIVVSGQSYCYSCVPSFVKKHIEMYLLKTDTAFYMHRTNSYCLSVLNVGESRLLPSTAARTIELLLQSGGPLSDGRLRVINKCQKELIKKIVKSFMHSIRLIEQLGCNVKSRSAIESFKRSLINFPTITLRGSHLVLKNAAELLGNTAVDSVNAGGLHTDISISSGSSITSMSENSSTVDQAIAESAVGSDTRSSSPLAAAIDLLSSSPTVEAAQAANHPNSGDTTLAPTPEGNTSPENATPEGDTSPENATPQGNNSPESETPENNNTAENTAPGGEATPQSHNVANDNSTGAPDCTEYIDCSQFSPAETLQIIRNVVRKISAETEQVKKNMLYENKIAKDQSRTRAAILFYYLSAIKTDKLIKE